MAGALQDKVVLITGSGRGIGQAIALECVRQGAKVVVNDLGTSPRGEGADQTPAHEVVRQIVAQGGRAVANRDDVSTMAGAQRMVETALEEFGRLDVVVNNAGIVRDRMVFNMSEEEWDRVIAVHLKGTFATTRAAAPLFREQRAGCFINMTSTSGLIGNYGQANYGAAKLGIVALTRITALEMAKYGVRANAIAPFAWSRLIGTIPADDPRQQDRLQKLQKMSPGKVAVVAAFLASEMARDISGQVIGVRGDEVILFSLPWPVRTIHRHGGWSVETLAEILPATWRHEFTPLQVTTDVFPYDPLV